MSDAVKLYGDASWECPWTFHVVVALEELRVRYTLELPHRPRSDDLRREMRAHAYLDSTPCLVHGDFWMTESSAITEYLAEVFAPPAHPRILPGDPRERGRARQVMSWLRTSLRTLRDERPASSVFLRPVTAPLGERARLDAEILTNTALALLPEGQTSLFSEWCIADVDLALALTRLIANSDPTPQRLVDYARAQWGRPSVRKYLAYIPTIH